MKTKRKDKNKKKPRYQEEEQINEFNEDDSLGKSVVLWVEGETEEAYFEGLRQNPWLTNNLAGIMLKKIGNLGNAMESLKSPNQLSEGRVLWIVSDNDKQNAFILHENDLPFFKNADHDQLPLILCKDLESAYRHDQNAYFLSVHDYLQWLKTALGADTALDYWDRIQFCTPRKWLLEKFDKKYIKTANNNIKLAYSCIAFEFWLLLHFEQNKTPFLWVDKDKSAEIDVANYLKTWRTQYAKGKDAKKQKSEKVCNAYTCLYDDFSKEIQTRDDEWRILTRIFTACKNAKWLRGEMLPKLIQQSGKWYEVNPYIMGLDILMEELLNIKYLRQPFNYFGLTLLFDFDILNLHLTLTISVNDGKGFLISEEHKKCFEIKNNAGDSFYPSIQKMISLPNEAIPISFQYTAITQHSSEPLVLVFKDPRDKSKSNQLFILLN